MGRELDIFTFIVALVASTVTIPGCVGSELEDGGHSQPREAPIELEANLDLDASVDVNTPRAELQPRGAGDGGLQQEETSEQRSALERVRAAARELLEEGNPSLWGQDGQLTPEELSNPFLTLGIEGPEAFNVLDSDGYEGDYKCNLLAFELVYRAGLVVPLMGRGRGWSYPGPGVIIDQYEGGHFLGDWAYRVEDTELDELQSLRQLGVVLMIAGARLPGTPGHVGIVDVVHRVEQDTTGRLAFVEYSGWEATREGGSYARRSWQIGSYTAIYLIALRDPGPGEPQVLRFGFGPLRASQADALRHSPEGMTIGRGRDGALVNRGRGLPELPVAHSMLGGESAFGRVVNVRSIAREAQLEERGLPVVLPPVDERVPEVDVDRILGRQ